MVLPRGRVFATVAIVILLVGLLFQPAVREFLVWRHVHERYPSGVTVHHRVQRLPSYFEKLYGTVTSRTEDGELIGKVEYGDDGLIRGVTVIFDGDGVLRCQLRWRQGKIAGSRTAVPWFTEEEILASYESRDEQ